MAREKSDKDYVNFLEQSAISSFQKGSPALPIRQWTGDGALPHTLHDPDLDKLVDKIAGGRKEGDADRESIEAGTTKETVSEGSPISMLEEELAGSIEDEEEWDDDADADLGIIDEDEYDDDDADLPDNETLGEDVSLHEKESDILSRLISEMNSLDEESENLNDEVDDYLDTDSDDEDNSAEQVDTSLDLDDLV